MNPFDACELAYKNGYEAGKKDAVTVSDWEIRKITALQYEIFCKNCGFVSGRLSKFCPDCGAKMKTSETRGEGGDSA